MPGAQVKARGSVGRRHLTPGWAAWVALLMLLGVLSLNRISEFLYWQF
jgi:hypothetical protein